ncbi:MAG: hypothetical protein HOQ24_17455 [Mycobacteriaceae bacterium]|nr:hypothetical protein [Mycobacteriaceae bacterium]
MSEHGYDDGPQHTDVTTHIAMRRAPRMEPRLLSPQPIAYVPTARLSRALPGPEQTPKSGMARDVRRAHITGHSGHDPEAQKFAEYALRLVLEVIDRKRIPATLAMTVDEHLLGQIRAIARGRLALPGRGQGAARPGKLMLRRQGPDDAEFYGTYTRAGATNRSFAIAGHIQRLPDLGWRLTALQFGPKQLM